MKRTTTFASIALAATALLASCGGKQGTVEVHLLPAEDQSVYFGYCNSDGDQLKRDDTVTLKDGVAVLDLNLFADQKPLAYFFYSEQTGQVYFVPQGDKLSFVEQAKDPNAKDPQLSFKIETAKLSSDNQKLQELTTLRSNYSASSKSLNEQYTAAAANNDTVETERIRNVFMALADSMEKVTEKFIIDNANNVAGQVALVNSLDKYQFNVKEFDAIVEKITNSTLKQELLAKIEPARKIQVGEQFIDVALPTPNGDTLRLSEIVSKNKVTLLDFWASWCGPCRKFNPILVKIYNKFHDKGFEIYGVSLDQDKDQWTAAIKDQNLTWFHVSNLKAWDCPARTDYLVRGIPSSVLIGSDGKIIAHSLEGDELEAKLQELLGE